MNIPTLKTKFELTKDFLYGDTNPQIFSKGSIFHINRIHMSDWHDRISVCFGKKDNKGRPLNSNLYGLHYVSVDWFNEMEYVEYHEGEKE